MAKRKRNRLESWYNSNGTVLFLAITVAIVAIKQKQNLFVNFSLIQEKLRTLCISVSDTFTGSCVCVAHYYTHIQRHDK